MIQIDKDIPMPQKNRRASKYPWTDLEVGDSFLYDDSLLSARGSAQARKKRIGNGVHFYAAKTPEGVRIWREK